MDLFVRTVVNSLIAAGILGLAGSAYYALRGRPYPPRRDPRRSAIVSLVMGAVGIVAYFAVPARVPAVAPRPIVTETRFESSGFPALAIEAPPGWRLDHDEAKRMVRILKGTGPIETAPSMLSIDTSLLEGEAVPDRLVGALRSEFEAHGTRVDAPFSDTLGQAEARGIVVHFPAGELCSWIVRRGRRIVSSVQCFSRDGASCRVACAPPLERLRWTTPSGVAATDL
jgi:hypothetical protein